MYNRSSDYLKKNIFLSDKQIGFKAHHSTSVAILIDHI